MRFSVWLDDLNPNVDAACVVEAGESPRRLRGTSLYYVDAADATEALWQARARLSMANAMNLRGR